MENKQIQIEQLKLNYVFTNTRKVDKAIPLTNSKVVAEHCGIEHDSAKRLIKKYINKFNELGNRNKKGGLEPLDLKSRGKNGTKNYMTWYELNENQVNFLITLFKNTPQVVEFKFKLVKEFTIMKDILQTQIIERRISKEHRKILTDAIQQCLGDDGKEYAKYTNMCYRILFSKTAMEIKEEILKQELAKCETEKDKKHVIKDIQKIVRDYFTDKELKSIERIENECATLLRIGMKDEKVRQTLKQIYPIAPYIII
ncbi:Rha family transcriptional regulator [Clostridium botulinum C]|uniref:Rha family transcriptional regulator n=1 Tax=Clostridium botulinum TaxID=1491 RepID=UPI001E2F7F0E|nr:Rha family transcriptional regulator [Clostridium botulinum]MCD3245244.1 Rha family transcriptional regulator [Clostridium botulinum C]MCD3261623.1 Rha family transcriptional regulator [Clostridium botulinum C]